MVLVEDRLTANTGRKKAVLDAVDLGGLPKLIFAEVIEPKRRSRTREESSGLRRYDSPAALLTVAARPGYELFRRGRVLYETEHFEKFELGWTFGLFRVSLAAHQSLPCRQAVRPDRF